MKLHRQRLGYSQIRLQRNYRHWHNLRVVARPGGGPYCIGMNDAQIIEFATLIADCSLNVEDAFRARGGIDRPAQRADHANRLAAKLKTMAFAKMPVEVTDEAHAVVCKAALVYGVCQALIALRPGGLAPPA